MRLFLITVTSIFIALFLNNSHAAELNSFFSANQQDSIISNAVIDVTYDTIASSKLNWTSELEQARIVKTLDNKGIRITLPNSDVAKVIIANKNGDKVLQTVSYAAPGIIDISRLRRGSYQLIIDIHGVVAVKTFDKKRK